MQQEPNQAEKVYRKLKALEATTKAAAADYASKSNQLYEAAYAYSVAADEVKPLIAKDKSE